MRQLRELKNSQRYGRERREHIERMFTDSHPQAQLAFSLGAFAMKGAIQFGSHMWHF